MKKIFLSKSKMYMAMLLCVLSFQVFAWPWDKKITLSGSSLAYNCNKFEHKAKTPHDIQVLMINLHPAMFGYLSRGNFVSYEALQSAYDNRDWRTAEKLIVEYECSLK